MCHHCDWVGNVPSALSGRAPELPKVYQKPKPPQQPRTDDARFRNFFHDRRISEQTIKDFGLYEENQRVVFPYFLDGVNVNNKYRTYDKQFMQTPKAQRTLFNADRAKAAFDAGDKTLVFVEGEMDVLACYEAGVIAVSLPDGAPNQVKNDPEDKRFAALASHDWLNEAEKVVLAVDADKNGGNLATELAHRFGKHRCWRVTWPRSFDVPCKDANETLITHDAEAIKEAILFAEPYPVDGLHRVKDFQDQVLDIYDGNYQRPIGTGYESLDKIYKVMPGTFQLVTGIPNHGKSNFLDQLIINLAKNHSWRFALFSPEHSAAMHIRRMLEKVNEKPFEIGVSERMSREEAQKGMEWLNDKFVFIENKDAVPDIDWVLEKAAAAAIRHGIKGIVVDPFNKIAQNRSGNQREDEHIRDTIAKCQKFAQSYNVTFWMVAHPHKLHKTDSGSYTPPTLYEVAGAAHWNNMCDIGMVVHRDFDEGTTRVIMRKVREQGLYGEIGEAKFRFHATKRVYEEHVDEPVSDSRFQSIARPSWQDQYD